VKRLVILATALTVLHILVTWICVPLAWTYGFAARAVFVICFPETLFIRWLPTSLPQWAGWLLLVMNSSVWGWGIAFIVEFVLAWRKGREDGRPTKGSEDVRV
jgi:phosphotransferase system  glucose/maltose/N-acetylglucosamine-specific IIC component